MQWVLFFCAHCTDEEAEAHRGWILNNCWGHIARKVWSCDVCTLSHFSLPHAYLVIWWMACFCVVHEGPSVRLETCSFWKPWYSTATSTTGCIFLVALEPGSDLWSFMAKDVASILMSTLKGRCAGRAGSICRWGRQGWETWLASAWRLLWQSL